MPDTNIRLQLLIGPTVPRPAPAEVIEAISSLEVTNTDSGRDGFQMSFTLGKDVKDLLLDYSLLLQNFFEPPNRVIIIVYIGASRPQVLIDGIITSHQIAPSNTPGGSTLVITGEDISLQMDLEEKIRRADWVVWTDCPAGITSRQIELILQEVIERYGGAIR